MSAAADLSNSVVCPFASVYCSGSTDSQLVIRMNTKSATAIGSTNGAIRIPMALSIWLRICMVSASQNSWTPLGTPLDVILARRKEARAITRTAALAGDSTVSVLPVSPSHVAVVCSPTSIWEPARIVSVIAGAPFLHPFRGRRWRRLAGAQLLPHRQRGRHDQQHLEERQSEDHTQTRWAENVSNDQPDDGDDGQP